MKLLLLTPNFPPELNSAARVFAELAEDLSRAAHQVTVLTRDVGRYVSDGTRDGSRRNGAGGFVRRERYNGVEVWRRRNLPMPYHLPLARLLEQAWMSLTFLLLGLRAGRHEAVIVYSPPLPLGLAGYLLARRWKAPFVLNVQDLYPQTVVDLGLLQNRTLIALARALERFLYRRADAITVHSEGNRAWVVAHGARADRVHVVYNWVDLQAVRPGVRDNGWRDGHALRGRFIVSFAGTMGFAQGLEDVPRAARRLADVPEIVFVLAGEGVQRAALVQRVREAGLRNVILLPPQSPDEYLALLAASDVCLVTLHRGLRTPVVPGKLPTIMAAGRAVVCVANPASDARRIIEQAQCGRFVEAGDASSLAEVIVDLFRHPELVEMMGRAGRTYAEAHFDRARCTARYAVLLDALLK